MKHYGVQIEIIGENFFFSPHFLVGHAPHKSGLRRGLYTVLLIKVYSNITIIYFAEGL